MDLDKKGKLNHLKVVPLPLETQLTTYYPPGEKATKKDAPEKTTEIIQEYSPSIASVANIALETGTTPVNPARKQAGSPQSKSKASAVVLIQELVLLLISILS